MHAIKISNNRGIQKNGKENMKIKYRKKYKKHQMKLSFMGH